MIVSFVEGGPPAFQSKVFYLRKPADKPYWYCLSWSFQSNYWSTFTTTSTKFDLCNSILPSIPRSCILMLTIALLRVPVVLSGRSVASIATPVSWDISAAVMIFHLLFQQLSLLPTLKNNINSAKVYISQQDYYPAAELLGEAIEVSCITARLYRPLHKAVG